jgi:hypothetical protein
VLSVLLALAHMELAFWEEIYFGKKLEFDCFFVAPVDR